jgi:hypothetical protein
MPLADARPEFLHRSPVADVADFELAVDLGSEGPQPLLAPGDEDAVPAPPGQLARGRLANPGGGARDER